MKKLSLLLTLFFSISVFLSSCEKEDTDNNENNNNNTPYTGVNCYNSWAASYSQSSIAVSDASQAYATDQSIENCNALKDAYQAFLDDLKPYENCLQIPASERQNFIDNLEEAENGIDSLC